MLPAASSLLEHRHICPPEFVMADRASHRALQAEEDKAVDEIKEYLMASVKKLASRFDRTEQHFWSLLHFKVKESHSKRRTSGFNAVVHELAIQENQGKFF